MARRGANEFKKPVLWSRSFYVEPTAAEAKALGWQRPDYSGCERIHESALGYMVRAHEQEPGGSLAVGLVITDGSGAASHVRYRETPETVDLMAEARRLAEGLREGAWVEIGQRCCHHDGRPVRRGELARAGVAPREVSPGKTAKIEVRVSLEERRAIQDHAIARGFRDLSSYMRHVAMHPPPKESDE